MLTPPVTVIASTRPVIGPCVPAIRSVAASASSPPLGCRSSSRIPSAPATSISPPGPPATISRRTIGMPISAGSMSMPAISIIFGIEPRLAMPMPAQAVQSMATPRVPGRVRRMFDTLLQSRSLAAL